MPDPKATVHFHSLGCPKNLLDTEVMLGTLASAGFALAEQLEDADVAVYRAKQSGRNRVRVSGRLPVPSSFLRH
jgi:GGDEF domain-containing protein